MSDKTSIEWADATWGPVTGCTRVSEGCDHCYIERTPPFRMARRKFDGDGPGSTTGVILHPERLDQPARWRKPRRIFVNSMSDLFHDDIPDLFIEQVWMAMEQADHHTYQILTKRPARMRTFLRRRQARKEDYAAQFADCPTEAMRTSPAAQDARWRADNPPRHIWVGVSVESPKWLSRVDALRDTPAAVRFISAEPLIAPLDGLNLAGIDWLICGGESGPGARLMQADWARSLRDECQVAGVAYLFKQWGEWAPTAQLSVGILTDPRERHGELVYDGNHPEVPWRRLYRRVGKKAAGRELDGRTWDEYPQVVPA